MKNFFSLFLVLVFISGIFLLVNNKKIEKNIAPEHIQYVNINDALIKVDVVITAEDQEKGLGGRESLAENEGMLFVFNNSGKHFFWMKDMKFAIDMVWLDEFGRIIYIEKNATPASYPELFGPKKSSKYVLEIPAGFSDIQNIQVGDKAEFLSITPTNK